MQNGRISAANLLLLWLVLAGGPPVTLAQQVGLPAQSSPRPDVLTPGQWQQLQASTEKGLAWLSTQQQRDGSFRCTSQGQPGVTSLCTMAFLAHGHKPGEGQYGEGLARAIQFVQRSQKRSGLIAVLGPDGPTVERTNAIDYHVGVAASYNHAISGLLLSEVYGMSSSAIDEEKLAQSIRKAVAATLRMQRWHKPRKQDVGGWRYVHPFQNIEADLSVAGWHLKLLRSAKNAGFEVPQQAIDDAVAYVLRCYNPFFQTFEYDTTPDDRRTRAMAGVGILALAHTSRHDRPEARAAADFILREGFQDYNRFRRYTYHRHYGDRYHYGVFYCTLAMYQIGGRHWQEYFPPTAKTLVTNQNPNGSWALESNQDAQYGQAYTTSLVLLALSAPNQVLPIYQR